MSTYKNLLIAVLIPAATAVSVSDTDADTSLFNAQIQRKSGRWLPVQVADISDGQLVVRMKGAVLRVKFEDVRGFAWDSPTPLETARALIESNRYEDVLTSLALFNRNDFLEPDIPAEMQRDTIVKLIADALIGMNRLSDASDIMQYITEDADVVVRRIRIHKALGEYAAAVALARKHTGTLEHAVEQQIETAQGPAAAHSAESAAVTGTVDVELTADGPAIRWSDLETAQLYYELGTALMAREDYEDALDELLKVKVLYRSDMDLVAQSEMRAMECYRKLHQYPRALRALSNIISQIEYAVVKPEASVVLTNVLMEFENEKELKRRIGGE